MPSSGGLSDQLRAVYGQIPFRFEANQGQTDAQVRFLSRGSGYALFLTATEAVLSLAKPVAADTFGAAPVAAADGAVLRLRLVGGQAAPAVTGLDPQVTRSNYLIGNDPAKWRTDVPNYGKVQYRGVYPGIDLVYYGNQRQLEYDFIVAPGADPNRIGLEVQGASGMELDAAGALVLHTAGGDVVEHAPVLYQETAAGRRTVAGSYVLEGSGRVGFRVGTYDHRRALVIDPVLVYSTYLGGSGTDYGTSIAVDGAGNAYVTGFTASYNFPTTPGAFQRTFGSIYDVFVAKLNAAGAALAYSTYLGGVGDDSGYGIAVDGAGNAYVIGGTNSDNFPTTPGAFQRTFNDGGAFVAKLNAAGSALAYSTYLGGSGYDSGQGIAVNGAGNAYITGYTSSPNFPTRNPIQPSFGGGYTDAFVAKLPYGGGASVLAVRAPASVTAGAVINVTITARNDDNQTDTQYTGTVHFTSSDPQAVLLPDYTFTLADNGVHTFAVTLKTAGARTVTATDTVFPMITGSATVTVSPAPASSLSLAGFPGSLQAGVTSSFTVTARDAYGNTATSYTGTVQFSSDPQAVLPGPYAFSVVDAGSHTFTATLKTAGPQSLTATDLANGALTGSQIGIVVTPAAADHLGVSPGHGDFRRAV